MKASVSNRLKVYAVEKNPNAVHTHASAQSENWAAVNAEIFLGDGRVWEAPEKCDILVSELLGSFGDNELSPECLDGAQRCLKQKTGICIATLYELPRTHDGSCRSPSVFIDSFSRLRFDEETPHVVKLYRHHLLDAARRRSPLSTRDGYH